MSEKTKSWIAPDLQGKSKQFYWPLLGSILELSNTINAWLHHSGARRTWSCHHHWQWKTHLLKSRSSSKQRGGSSHIQEQRAYLVGLVLLVRYSPIIWFMDITMTPGNSTNAYCCVTTKNIFCLGIFKGYQARCHAVQRVYCWQQMGCVALALEISSSTTWYWKPLLVFHLCSLI